MNAQSGHISQVTPVVEYNVSCPMRLPGCHPVQAHGNGRERTWVLNSGEQIESDLFPVLAETGRKPESRVFERALKASGQSDGVSKAADVLLVADVTSTCLAETQTRPARLAQADALTASDVANLSAVFDHEIARNTMTNYRAQWNNFVVWATAKGIRTLPSDPAQVAAYLAERIEELGHRPATLRVAASAIAFVHRNAGLEDPCASLEVKKTLRCATRKAGRHQKQAEALTAEAMAAIESTACEPRLGRGGRFESQETARRRGNLDIALIGLMRDAMLRVSEAAALTWKDIAAEPDGTGRLLIRNSKTDVEGQGNVVFLSNQTMEALALIRNKAAQEESVFGLRPNQMADRIKNAALAAGLGEGFSGHSPRVGMARDLARAGIELPRLMNAGRWRSATMPAHYTRNETAGRGAVAQFHGNCPRTDR